MGVERLLAGPSANIEAMLEASGAGFTGAGGGVEGLLAGEVCGVGDDFAPGGLAGRFGPVSFASAGVGAWASAKFAVPSSGFPASQSFFFLFYRLDLFHCALHLLLNLFLLRLHLVLDLFALLLALLL